MGDLSKGYIQVYTGNGKGKTSAALGSALRAAGAGLKIHITQFMKDFPYSERKSLEKFAGLIDINFVGKDEFVFKKENPPESEIELAKSALQSASSKMQSGKFNMIILDEIFVAVFFKLLTEEDVIEFIKSRPENIELILTGRYCPESIIKLADLVTEMKEVKHYYQQGVISRKGIDC
ncbi:MAG: cob(I)yrinic acid a,c-diamide adenosyltransferase [Melioribacteraceae bacterium]|nr:cob(I)yrinic acid a,c-diamide adenosyltransferase [Melioribacteraceae bacterium]MCF8354221.1 cob(I)yrinic acid a,c-diamide adenosyltransferase [Melioribacteraceae bacterium]MCF8392867.1 cob(I)yrinic acid a,c-diamide adenosyltransferase [Melioribacteraceae bacterium]MCF8418647.1 cob(I)yrinic acid a,c-diamide adenosyltransferase [Melioribacteraceae bacterium]